MEHDAKDSTPVPAWLWLAVVAFTIAVFAIGYWRFGSVWMAIASVLAEFAIAALLFFGTIPK